MAHELCNVPWLRDAQIRWALAGSETQVDRALILPTHDRQHAPRYPIDQHRRFLDLHSFGLSSFDIQKSNLPIES